MTLTPYPFQTALVEYLKPQRNVLVGDDMGAGKTIEGILLDAERRKVGAGKTLVITPMSVVGSWRKHFSLWAPDLKVIVLDRKNRPAFIKAAEDATHDVYIMHWETLRLMPELQKVRWLHIIADEVHKIKNRKAQMTVALKKLRPVYKTAMSGTPADNKPEDAWSIFNWLYPQTFSSYNRFYDYHIKHKYHNAGGNLYEPCKACAMDGKETVHQNSYKETTGVHDMEGLHAQIKPWYMRRLKEEILPDLPEKYYSEIEVELTPQQQRAYDQMAEKMLAWVGEHEDEPIAAPIVVAQLMRLQQFGVAYGELVEVRKPWPKEHIAHSKRMYKLRHGEDPPADYTYYDLVKKLKLTEPSSKLDALMDIIDSMGGEPIGVFSQSKQVINLLATRLRNKDIPSSILTGDTKQADRDTVVDQFQSGRTRVFAGTIKAGGVGLTLTAASTCVFLDRDWSPSVNRQAEDRYHRIGQLNAVHIIDLIGRGTVDLGKIQKVELKWGWVKELLGDPQEVKKRMEDKK
jgi:SNF2 family DNA or RNA helicase